MMPTLLDFIWGYKMRNKFIIYTSACSSFITSIFGGWTGATSTLLIFIIIDYITGLLPPILYQNSPKTKNGGLSSELCYKGIIKKITIFFYIIVAHRLDLILNISYLKDFVTISFIINEVISILENGKLLNLPMPKILYKAIDLLNEKIGGNENDN